MPPASYIIWAVVLIGGGIASMAVTTGYSIFLIYWAFRVAAALAIVMATWRIVLVSGIATWPAIIVTIACVTWLVGLLGGWFGQMFMMHVASVFGLVSLAACGAAAWQMQAAFRGLEPQTPVYVAAFALIAALMLLSSNLLPGLPTMVRTSVRYAYLGLSVLGCALIIGAIHRMVRLIDEEYWIVVVTAMPVGLLAYVLLAQLVPSVLGRWGDGAMFILFPFLSLIGAMGFWRLSKLVHDRMRLRAIETLNAGRLAA